MEGTITALSCGGRRLCVYTPPGYDAGGSGFPVVYANGSGEEAWDALARSCEAGRCGPCIYVAVPSENWEEDYSPWPAPAAFKGSNAFPGGGGAYLRYLTEEVKPAVEAAFRTRAGESYLMGYSLGGLHALWAAYRCGAFQGYASLSGSLWYEGWMEFAAGHAPVNPAARVYLSLGSTEEKARSARLRTVGDCTRETFRLLQGQLASPERAALEWNPGGHFSGIPERFCAALCWLLPA